MMKQMRLEQPGHFSLSDTQNRPVLENGMAIVRPHCIGVCGTDLHAFEGSQPFFSYPRILGHELGVEIVEIAEHDRGLKPGDRCAVIPYLHCGDCIACKREKTNCCASLKVMGVHVDGGMRDLFLVPISHLLKSETLHYEQLALIETLGIGKHAVTRANLEKGEWILVIGVGPIGLTVVEFAKLADVNIVVADRNDKRLSFCQNTMGVQHGINGKQNISDYFQKNIGDLPTTVFDCTGNSNSMRQSFQYTANGGQLVFVGLFIGDVSFHDPEFHRREMTLKSSRNARGVELKEIVHLMETGKIDTTPWITHHTNPQELSSVFPEYLKPETGVVKAIVEWD